MIIIGIDPSLNSTAISVYKNGMFYVYNYTNKDIKYKWIKEINNYVNFKFHEYNDETESFSESETEKIKIYDIVTDKIFNDIKEISDQQTEVFIEGYSYSSAQGRLIDLVTFSTLLRIKLVKHGINLNVIPPSTLKKTIAEQVYPLDKKGIPRDENDKAGGSFDKKDMMKCLIKLNVNCSYIDYLKTNKDILLKPKNIPKPFDDCNDAMLLSYFGIISFKL